MNVINKRYYRAPELLQPLIEFLMEQPRQVFEIRDWCEISRLGAWDDLLETMNELKEIGMLVCKAPAVLSEIPVQDTVPPLTRSLALPVIP